MLAFAIDATKASSLPAVFLAMTSAKAIWGTAIFCRHSPPSQTATAGLIDDHYFAIAGVVTRRSERLVKLYSPLVDVGVAAVSTPNRRDDARRHTVVSLDDYRGDFDQLVVSTLGVR